MNKKQQQVRKKHRKTKVRLKGLRVLSLSKMKKTTKSQKPIKDVVEEKVVKKTTTKKTAAKKTAAKKTTAKKTAAKKTTAKKTKTKK